jgi:uncharacterized protein
MIGESMRSQLRAGTACLLLLLASVTAAQSQTSSSTVVISQVYGGGGNSGAPLRNDFIELYNRGTEAVSLAGWSVQYASAGGNSWQVTVLTGALQPGQYYLVQQAAGTTTPGAPPLPTPDTTGAIPMSATAGKVALVDTTTALTCGAGCLPNPAIRDFVGYGTGASGANSFEGTGPAPTLSNTTAALRLVQGCTDTDNNAADFVAGAPGPRNTSDINPSCEPPPPPTCTPDMTIAAVQGSGQTSPVVGNTVSVEGIVTGRITTGSARGFFVQMPEGEDADPATSDGIFVFTGNATPPANAQVGNEVCVTGRVAEFPSAPPLSQSLTEITQHTVVTLISTGNTPPAAITLTAADTPPDAYGALERYEGMRVHVASLTVVAPTDGFVNEPAATSTSDGVFYGVIEDVARPFREPGLDIFDVLPAGAPATIPRFDSNPERLRVDSDILGGPQLNVAAGQTVTNLTGPLYFTFRTYAIYADAAGTPAVSGAAAAMPLPLPTLREFTVASTNLERFFDTVNDPDTGDPVLTADALERRLAKISLAIRTVLQSPDIIGVMETENQVALQTIADRVNADTVGSSPNYQAFVIEGNDVGGIDVGLLVKTSRVTVVDVEQVGKDATWVNPDGETETLNDRPPLVLRAEVTLPAGTLPVTVIANHTRSLIGIEDPSDGSRVRAKRRAQAEFLATYIQMRQMANPQERILSIGDYNAFQFTDGYVDVIGTIRGQPAPATDVTLASLDLVNPDLMDAIEAVPPSQRYSYVFDGNAQVLDHVLLNPPALANLTRIVIAHNNADFPEVLRNEETRPERYSDHDVPVAYFQLMPEDVSARVRTFPTPFIFIPFRGTSVGAVLLQNASRSTITGPVHLVFEGLPPGVTLANADGELLGAPYLTVPFTQTLRPDQIALAVVELANPDRVPITFTIRTVAGAF